MNYRLLQEKNLGMYFRQVTKAINVISFDLICSERKKIKHKADYTIVGQGICLH